MSIQGEIERINSTVAEQVELIQEITDILDEKVSPSPPTEFTAKYGWVRYPVPDNPTTYIQSNGTQYIDTGFKPNQNTGYIIDADILPTNDNGTVQTIHISTSNEQSTFYALRLNSMLTAYNVRYAQSELVSVKHLGSLFGRHLFVGEKNTFSIDGQEPTVCTSAPFQQSKTLPILGAKTYGTTEVSNMVKAKLYSCKIFDNGVLVRCFIPSKDPDGVICLFDCCTGEYFYNGGTGTFTGSAELKPIEESYACSDNANAYPDGGIADGYFYKKLPLQVSDNQGGAGGLVSYNVSNVEGATHGFVFSGDYYVSQNKGVSSSAALCRVDFNTTTPVKVNVYCISYGENKYDFGILSKLNTMLTTSSSEDSSTGVYKSFKGLSSSSEQLVTYDLPTGKSFISIKYRKDTSGNSNDDTLKFRIELSEA